MNDDNIEDNADIYSPTTVSKELISIQAGPASNWIGSHFWNLQERALNKSEFLNTTFFAEHEKSTNLSTLSLTPRLLVLDVLGSVCSPQIEFSNAVAARSSNKCAWDGEIQELFECNKNSQKPVTDNNNNDSVSQFWTQCLLPIVKNRWRGEKTIMILQDYLDASKNSDVFASPKFHDDIQTMNDSESPSFLSSYSQGLDLFRPGSEVFERFENKFHLIAEECDRPSGFCLSMDSDSGFSGVSLRIGEYLSEEFPKRPVMAIPIASVLNTKNCSQRRWSTTCLNRLRLYTSLEQGCDWPGFLAWLPLGYPNNSQLLTEKLDPCTSAGIMAAGLAAFLTPLQLRSKSNYACDLYNAISSLTPTRKKMLSLSMNVQADILPFSNNNWLHPNPLAHNRLPIRSHQQSNITTLLPTSLVSQLFTYGIDLTSTKKLAGFLKNGIFCSSDKNTEPSIRLCFPQNPFSDPRFNDKSDSKSMCKQPSPNQCASYVEAPNNSSDRNQWLASGLIEHSSKAFIAKFHQNLEIDDFREFQELSTNLLIEEYASCNA